MSEAAEILDFEQKLKAHPGNMKLWSDYVDWINAQPVSFKRKYLAPTIDRCIDHVCSSSDLLSRHSNDKLFLDLCHSRAVASGQGAAEFYANLFKKKIGVESAEFFELWAAELSKVSFWTIGGNFFFFKHKALS